MLEELRIQNFAIIDDITLTFANGFNVITGETGAGKSILIDAVELLLGNSADQSYIRAGEERAIVEGTFVLPEQTRSLIAAQLLEVDLIQDEDEAASLMISRELRKSGRSASRINGITCSADVLRSVGELLIDIHGQSDHLSLFKPRTHMDLLDRYAHLLEVRAALATVVDSLHAIRRETRQLQQDKAELQRRAERLRFEIDEIDGAELQEGEEPELEIERSRLANSERIAELVSESVNLLTSEEDEGEHMPVVDALMHISGLMEKLLKIDATLQDDYALAESIAASAQELAINLSSYAEEIEYDADRLNELEERIDMIKRLKRRFQVEDIAGLLAYANKARQELDGLEHSEDRLQELARAEEQTLRHIGDLCERIAKTREIAGRALAKRIIRELKALRMDDTRFEVVQVRQQDPQGAYGKDGKRYKFDDTGMEDIEFMMSANPGEPLRPLQKVASGGEAARIMLALKRVLAQADHTPTLIFDEIDQGIGGRLGAVVGEKLWSLTDGHQVLCVTHLPQLASFADRHFHVSKQVKARRTVTQVSVLEQDAVRTEEIAAMLGAIGESGVQSARDILADAARRKGELHHEDAAAAAEDEAQA
jgi:DNA repair protein RecN (Recombination protein N)